MYDVICVVCGMLCHVWYDICCIVRGIVHDLLCGCVVYGVGVLCVISYMMCGVAGWVC